MRDTTATYIQCSFTEDGLSRRREEKEEKVEKLVVEERRDGLKYVVCREMQLGKKDKITIRTGASSSI